MNTVRNILLAQIGLTAVLAAAVGMLLGRGQAVSLLTGGLIGVVPNAFLAARILSPRAASSARAALRAAWIGEAGKLTLTALLFAAAFIALKPLHPAALFGGFIATQLAAPLGLLADGNTGSRDQSRSAD